jgi:DNA-binding transcriptional LysR family regulator
LTLDGIGISTLPLSVIKHELESGRLVQLNTSWTPSELAFTASYSGAPFNPIAELAANLAVMVSDEYDRTTHHENLSQDPKNDN